MNGEEDAELLGERRHLAEEEPQVVPDVVLRESPIGLYGLPERLQREGVRGAVLGCQSREDCVPELSSLRRAQSLEVVAGALKGGRGIGWSGRSANRLG